MRPTGGCLFAFLGFPFALITCILQIRAVDPDLGRNGMVLYDLQRQSNGSAGLSPLPFSVDAQTGLVTVIDSPLALGRYALFIEASDQPANPSERRYSLAVVTVEVKKAGSKSKHSNIYRLSLTYSLPWRTIILVENPSF